MKKEISAYFAKHQGVILNYMLAAIGVLFISILIVVYFAARQANPVFLDEKGKPVQTQTDTPKQY
ncbi:hypothetical protein BH10ACI3_BH10ACI3_25920 [soil metagenome]